MLVLDTRVLLWTAPHASTTLWTPLNNWDSSVSTNYHSLKQLVKQILSKRLAAKLEVGKRAVQNWVTSGFYTTGSYSILPFVTLKFLHQEKKNSQHYHFTCTGHDRSPLKAWQNYIWTVFSADLWCCPILRMKRLFEWDFSFANTSICGFHIAILMLCVWHLSLFPLYWLKPKFLGDSKPPVLAAILHAIHRNKQPTGLQLVLYTDAQPTRSRMQVFVSSITGSSRWKLCADVSLINSHKVAVSFKQQSAQMEMKYNDLTMFYTKPHLFLPTRALLNGVKIARTTTSLRRLQQGIWLLIQPCRWSWSGQKYLQQSEQPQDGEASGL